jgi:phospholipid-binding lipoprotein MlaA
MRNVFRSSRASLAAAAISAVLLGGCATTGNPDDPLEGYNRAMFSFNEQVDKVAIKPAAQVYEAVLPQPVRTGVGNVLGNLGDPWVALNNLLQGKVAEGMSDLMRFALNSTWGLLGLLDIAERGGPAQARRGPRPDARPLGRGRGRLHRAALLRAAHGA